jgi:hypothetical protein
LRFLDLAHVEDGGDDPRADLAQVALGDSGIDRVSEHSVEVVDDHVVDIFLFFNPSDHFLEHWAPVDAGRRTARFYELVAAIGQVRLFGAVALRVHELDQGFGVVGGHAGFDVAFQPGAAASSLAGGVDAGLLDLGLPLGVVGAVAVGFGLVASIGLVLVLFHSGDSSFRYELFAVVDCALRAFLRDALFGQCGVGRVELDAYPVPLVVFGGQRHGSGSHEGIEHDAASPTGVLACWLQRAGSEQTAVPALLDSSPRLSTGCAHSWRAGGEQRLSHQFHRERCEVRPVVAGRGDLPDVAGVLAERVAFLAAHPHGGQSVVDVHPRAATAAQTGYGCPRRIHRSTCTAAMPWEASGSSNSVEVEVVLRLLGEEVDELVRRGETVGARERHGVRLGPHHLVTQ